MVLLLLLVRRWWATNRDDNCKPIMERERGKYMAKKRTRSGCENRFGSVLFDVRNKGRLFFSFLDGNGVRASREPVSLY